MKDRTSPSPGRAALARDAALLRQRRLTGGVVVVALALSGMFAGVAASSTHAKKAVRRARRVARTSSSTIPALPAAPSAPVEAATPTPPAAAPSVASPLRSSPVEAHKALELAPGVASWRALGTSAVIAVTESSALEAGTALVKRELDAIDAACSRFRPDSELVRLNAAAGEDTEVSPLLFEAVQTAVAAARASAGLVDPTVGRTLRLAGYDRTFAIVCSRDGRHFTPSFARDPDWHTIRLDEGSRTVRVPAGVELDLGATAKALAADHAARRVFAATASGVLVSLGGDIAVAGPPPPGGWSVRIAEDHAEPLDGPGPIVAIASGGLATSGTTVRAWASREGPLHHIIDPRTGRTATGLWRTVSVAAASCVDANTASTAAIVIGEKAPDWLAKGGLPARLVRYDGAVTVVGGWPKGST